MSRKQRDEQSSRVRKRVKKLKLVEKRKLFNELLAFLFPTGSIFSKEQFHGNIKWKPEQLVIHALIWSWQDTKKVTDAFEKNDGVLQEAGIEGHLQDLHGIYGCTVHLSKYDPRWLTKSDSGIGRTCRRTILSQQEMGASWI